MKQHLRNAVPNMGVLYTCSEYAGLGRRFAILVIDLIVVIVGWGALGIFWFSLFANPQAPPELAFRLSMVGFVFLYFVLLERSNWGTLGFRLCGVRIVDQYGGQPSIFKMMLRQTVWLLWPFNPFVDFVWLGGDIHRQSLRDKFAATYVVRRKARPIGSGRIRSAYYDILGASFVFWEIQEAAVPEKDA